MAGEWKAMFESWSESNARKRKIEDLEERLHKLLENDFGQSIDEERLKLILLEERLVKSNISALRLLQGEHRLMNNFLIALLAFIAAIVGGAVGSLFH